MRLSGMFDSDWPVIMQLNNFCIIVSGNQSLHGFILVSLGGRNKLILLFSKDALN